MSHAGGNSGAASGVQVSVVTVGVHELMAAFDRLPARHRRVLRDAPYNIAVRGVARFSICELTAELAEVQRQSVVATYGPTHPQAGDTV